MDDRLTYIGSQDMQAGGSIEDGLWLIALGAAIADKDFRSDLLESVPPKTKNTHVGHMLEALGKDDIKWAHDSAEMLGFPVRKGDRCLPSLITALRNRATSRRCSVIASKLDFCARLTPENFLTMLKEAAEEMANAGTETS